jgi:hypothetical protein
MRAIHAFWDVVLKALEETLPTGVGHCVVLRKETVSGEPRFYPSLKFDDIELVRRLSKEQRFATWVRASLSLIGATGKKASSGYPSYILSWRLPSPLASSGGPASQPTSSETTTLDWSTIRRPAD